MRDTDRPTDSDAAARRRIDRRLFARREAGDPSAREQVVERFLPLAPLIARRYEHGNESLEDLVQVASLALVMAIDRYDPASGRAFSSFAVPTIAGALERDFRDRTWMVRPPCDLQELTLHVQRATTQLTEVLDRAADCDPVTCDASTRAMVAA